MNQYNMKGEPISEIEAAKIWLNPLERRVDGTYLPNGYWVSTVLLVYDHSYGDGPPVIFETMVFPTPRRGEICERYSTVDEARRGHAEIVRQVRRWKAPKPPQEPGPKADAATASDQGNLDGGTSTGDTQ